MKHALATLVLTSVFCAATTAQASDVEIRHFRHAACVVGDQRIFPIYALSGGKTRVKQGASWSCEDVIKSGLLSCERAVQFPFEWQAKQYPDCLQIFHNQVQACVAHYGVEQGKCGSVGAGRRPDASSRAPAQRSVFDGRWQVTDRNKFGHTNIWNCTLRTKGRRIFSTCDVGDNVTGTVSGRTASMQGGPNTYALDLLIVDEDTLKYSYPFGRGMYKRIR